jgi:hypothetical protein
MGLVRLGTIRVRHALTISGSPDDRTRLWTGRPLSWRHTSPNDHVAAMDWNATLVLPPTARRSAWGSDSPLIRTYRYLCRGPARAGTRNTCVALGRRTTVVQ